MCQDHGTGALPRPRDHLAGCGVFSELADHEVAGRRRLPSGFPDRGGEQLCIGVAEAGKGRSALAGNPETIANRHSRSTASPSPPSLFSSPRWIRPGISLRDRHARLSHGSVNGLPSTAAAGTKARNCRLGRGASARARHCCAGRSSCAGVPVGQRVGVEDGRTPPTVGFFDPPFEPARGAAAATRLVPSPRPDRQRRVQLDRVSATAYSIAVWKVRSRARASTVVIIQISPSTGAVHQRPRSQHWSMLGNTDTSHGPRADTVDD
jgi:hypothetical protein